jgi:hypothetical protein
MPLANPARSHGSPESARILRAGLAGETLLLKYAFWPQHAVPAIDTKTQHIALGLVFFNRDEMPALPEDGAPIQPIRQQYHV